jgi:hypothetical protein
MRPTLAVLVLLLACTGESDVPQTLKIPVRGLYSAQNARGNTPPGALTRAEDIEVRNGEAVKRRGTVQAVAQGADAIWPFQDRLLVHQGSALYASDGGVTAVTQYVGSYLAATGRKLKFASANGNAYLATTSGVKRLDSVDGTPVDAGVAPGLDVQGALTGSSGFLPNDSAVAYRAVWGTRDANGNLILGAPSGRAVVVNQAGASRDVSVSTSIPDGVTDEHFWQLYRTAPSELAAVDPGDEMGLVYEGPRPASAAVTQLARATNVVTATTSAAHGFAVGQTVRVGPGALTGGIAAIGLSVAASSGDGMAWTTRTNTQSLTAVAWNGSLYAAVGLDEAASSPDGIAWTTRTIPAGQYRAVAWNGARFVAVGDSGVCATSIDGITWTARTTPGGSYSGLAWNGSTLVAVGDGAAATSPDGITWTARSLTGTLYAVAWNGTRFVAVGGNVTATSPDGVSWTTAAIAGVFHGVAWNGAVFAAAGSSVAATSPDGLTWTARTIPAGNYWAVVWSGSVFAAVGWSVAASSPDGAAWTAQTIVAGSFFAAATGAGGLVFSAGEKTVTTTPTSLSFTYAEAGTDGTVSQAQTATPLTATVVDQIPSTFAGATLYTSQSQEGILASAYEPPAAVDLAEFRGTMFWLGTTERATLDLYVLASGAPSGLQSGDTITINGMVFTAGAAEAIGTRTFQVYTAGTPSQNVANTAASLVRAVNRAQGSPVYCRDLSGSNEAPGHLQLTTRVRTDSIALAVSRSSAFALTDGTTADPETKPHELRWSANGKPDAAPITNTRTLGDKNKEGLRVFALRDYAFVLKKDGIWRVSGDGTNWAISPLDTTTEIVAPESAVVLDNTIFALSNKGVVQITDTGVTIVSGPISDIIDRLLAEPMLSTVRTVAHGAAYEAEGKYVLWIPSDEADTEATAALVFDQFESLRQGAPVWTTRTDDASCAVVNPKDGKLYRATSAALYRERKALDYTDLSDGESAATIGTVSGATVTLTVGSAEEGDALEQGDAIAVILSVSGSALTLDRTWTGTTGAVTVHAAIPSVLEFAPAIPAPGVACRFMEAAFLFRHLSGGRFEGAFATEFTRANLGFYELPYELGAEADAGYGIVPFYGTRDYGLSEVALYPVNLRTWIPMDQQRAERLAVRFTHRQALSPMALEGLSIVWAPVSSRLRR